MRTADAPSLPETLMIDLDYQEILKRQQETAPVRRLEPSAVIPIEHCIVEQFYGNSIGRSLSRFYHDPDEMLYTSVMGQKWELENVRSHKSVIGLRCTLTNMDEACSLGAEPYFPGGDFNIPNVKPWIKSKTDLTRLAAIDPLKSGYRQRSLVFRDLIRSRAERVNLVFRDGTFMKLLEFSQGVAGGGGTMGPFTIAQQLRGAEIYYDLVDNPSFVDEMLEIITDKIIRWQEFLIEDYRRNGASYALFVADDSAANLSLEHFDRFSGRYVRRIMEHFQDRYKLWHMCGNTNHLLDYFAQELPFQEYSLFGFAQDKQKIRSLFGGRCVLKGNVDPKTIHLGSRQDVFDESMQILNVFKDVPGFILSDGANIPPGSPKQNINAMYDAVQAALSNAR